MLPTEKTIITIFTVLVVIPNLTVSRASVTRERYKRATICVIVSHKVCKHTFMYSYPYRYFLKAINFFMLYILSIPTTDDCDSNSEHTPTAIDTIPPTKGKRRPRLFPTPKDIPRVPEKMNTIPNPTGVHANPKTR